MRKNRSSFSNNTNQKLSLTKAVAYFGFLAITVNALIDLFDKWKTYYTAHHVQSYVPDWIDNIHINDTTKIESIFTTSVYDIIKRKWWYDSIPHTITYKNNGAIIPIDLDGYTEIFPDTTINLLNQRGSSEISRASGLIGYLQKDFSINQCILEDVSSQRIGITPHDSYRDKVAKIHQFVRSLGNERDVMYLGEDKSLVALSNYQLPAIANLMIGKMDCNNKAWLVIQLCWVHDIVVGIWASKTHMTPVVYSHEQDGIRKYIEENTSVWDTYKWIVVDPSNSAIVSGVRRPAIAGDIVGDQYLGMKFVLAKKN
jgi:hypothetical protein